MLILHSIALLMSTVLEFEAIFLIPGSLPLPLWGNSSGRFPKPSSGTSEVCPSLANRQSVWLIRRVFCLIWWLIIVMRVINAGSSSAVHWLDGIDWETTWVLCVDSLRREKRNILAFELCDFFFLSLLHAATLLRKTINSPSTNP